MKKTVCYNLLNDVLFFLFFLFFMEGCKKEFHMLPISCFITFAAMKVFSMSI